MEEIPVILFAAVIFVIFVGLLSNSQTRKIIVDLLFGRM